MKETVHYDYAKYVYILVSFEYFIPHSNHFCIFRKNKAGYLYIVRLSSYAVGGKSLILVQESSKMSGHNVYNLSDCQHCSGYQPQVCRPRLDHMTRLETKHSINQHPFAFQVPPTWQVLETDNKTLSILPMVLLTSGVVALHFESWWFYIGL